MKRRQFILLGAASFAGCKGKEETGTPVMFAKETIQVSDPRQDPTQRDPMRPDPRGQMIRGRSIERLRVARFKVAEWLPTAGHRAGVPGTLRPHEEIARRFLALAYAVAWVAGADERSPTDQLRSFADRGGLFRFLAPKERAIVAESRVGAKEKYLDTIGWRMENLWALAWVLGFSQEPSFSGELVGESVMKPLIEEFLPRWDSDPEVWIRQAKLRPSSDIVALEDLFYCAHNAARSAQLGRPGVVPAGFDPILNAGAIHERRHSLTWVLSPGIAWDDTDLST